jgi:hypothetical protein
VQGAVIVDVTAFIVNSGGSGISEGVSMTSARRHQDDRGKLVDMDLEIAKPRSKRP